jgi:DNA polymerase-3 subunit delta'
MKSYKSCGQEQIMHWLQTAILDGMVVHAYLFSGPEGIGKKTLANIFAMALHCEHAAERPCEMCLPCQKVAANIHPDVHWILPEGKAVKIDQVRQVKRIASLRPHEGRYQVFILDAAGTMTPEAANSLLKVLEEPPAGTLFILLAENPRRLPQTIVSRCQLVTLRRLSPASIEALLDCNEGLSTRQKEMITRMAEGIPGKALALAGNSVLDRLQIESTAVLAALREKSGVAALSGQIAGRDDLTVFLDMLLTVLRDLLVLLTTGEGGYGFSDPYVLQLRKLAQAWSAHSTYQAITAILDLQKNLNSPVNVRLALERAFRTIKEVH